MDFADPKERPSTQSLQVELQRQRDRFQEAMDKSYEALELINRLTKA